MNPASMNPATKTFKALSALLSYPSAALQAAEGELVAAVEAEALVPVAERHALRDFIIELCRGDLIDMQARYVALFDRGRALSLHLFEHIHGESRDRGQAMVDLAALYASHGLEISENELPDFLPLFLEFLASLPVAEARALLGEPAHIITALEERLRRRASPYSVVFRALATLATAPAGEASLGEVVTKDENENDPEVIDQSWEEAEVRFDASADPTADLGADLGGCPIAEDMLGSLRKSFEPGAGERRGKAR